MKVRLDDVADVGWSYANRFELDGTGLLRRHTRRAPVGNLAPVSVGVDGANRRVTAIYECVAVGVRDEIPRHRYVYWLAKPLAEHEVVPVLRDDAALKHVEAWLGHDETLGPLP
jgi:hypothetical protein